MSKKSVLILLVLAVFLLVGASCQKQTTQTTSNQTNRNTAVTNTAVSGNANSASLSNTASPTNTINQNTNTTTVNQNTNTASQTKEFNVTAQQFSFNPSTIRVKLGDRVRLNITSTDVEHGFAIDALGVSQTIPAGQTTTVEFTASETGTFTFYCNVVCGAGHSDMQGQLIVE